MNVVHRALIHHHSFVGFAFLLKYEYLFRLAAVVDRRYARLAELLDVGHVAHRERLRIVWEFLCTHRI